MYQLPSFAFAFSIIFLFACNTNANKAESVTSNPTKNEIVEKKSDEIASTTANTIVEESESKENPALKKEENKPEVVKAKLSEKVQDVPEKPNTKKAANSSNATTPKDEVPSNPVTKVETKVEETVKEEIKILENKVEEIKEEVKVETTPPVEVIKEEVIEEKPILAKPDHGLFDAILRANVSSSGKVNYKAIKASIGKLEAYLKNLESNPIESSWSKNEKMAYWINAYNAYTIKLIVDNYPLGSITDLHGGKPWDVKWINIAGKSYSLNNIENDILRPQYKDARIHFAVNCAAKSCPTLLNRAWTAGNLNSNFDKMAKAFINNSDFNQISKTNIKVSKIFDWYKVDFGNLISYLNKYAETQIDSNAKIEYLEYNWSLNE